MKQKNILIIGATSTMAYEVAKKLAHHEINFFLIARNKEKLMLQKNELLLLGAQSVHTLIEDCNSFKKHAASIDKAFKKLKYIDYVLLAQGTLTDQSQCIESFEALQTEVNTNAMSYVSYLTEIRKKLIAQKSGHISVISSVAGDRGRQSNYIYGSAKAMLSTFTNGLRNELQQHNIGVLLIKPGFVDTKMTAHIKKSALWAKAPDVAEKIIQAIQKKKNIIYVPGFWRPIMLIIKSIPEFIFKKLKL